MTNTIAIWLAMLVIVFFSVDAVVFDGVSSLFLAQELMLLTEWVAFWR
ncbi:hypothetical protein [Rhodobacter sp. TJ_12]|nr:hypothetical protein [Rhodobacter sp. TJ_12]